MAQMKKKEDAEKMIVDHLGPTQQPQLMSGRWVDSEGATVMIYLSSRPKKTPEGPQLKPLDEQYMGRMEKTGNEDEYYHDGLHPLTVRRCWEAAQDLFSLAQPVMPKGERDRHGQPRSDGGKEQGWVQTGHNNGNLFLSRDMIKTSTAASAVRAHYEATQFLAEQLKVMFRVLFPTIYQRYQAAFDAGVWYKEDPGPFLGRAHLWKLQVTLHRDQGDGGPSISFPFGSYHGGELLVPQLKAKLQ
ncbi:hypothetical protein GLOTRDRAFT_134160 [Gloeophyllum trabeum ATCC 11539]|uniref:Uncharacterized protein n=1 Tax=Gloeophyllum trabeum (strain ATCC 11539 / FP-39264 / Madison 617) TaxID=670483 RepID=S7PQW0_GLOTA|nr:uncharacterized protein GLOTRDRAFT_134160 [Gloeophyllum trabeum ATCC 11539]EPQ50201.1 hypothetical protein GLOTRDRAFT_134160 [Gloeophyllum trabeum ATCC 11539]